MEDENDNNLGNDEPGADQEFRYNFISKPWDDRSTASKAGIASLLVAIIAVTLACVIHNFVTHFEASKASRSLNSEIKCHLVKVDEHLYAARIHSVDSGELLCVGAVVSPSTVVANGVCAKAGPIRLRLGTPSNPRCKKGFSVDVVETINHEGTVSKHVVLLTSYENMAECVQVIKIGNSLDWNSKAYIIGRPLRGGRTLSQQPAKLARMDNFTGSVEVPRSTLCVKDLGKCPVRAGDLLVQGRRVFGLASTSTHVADAKQACFADLRIVRELREHK